MNILLLEPNYKNKFPPVGLMKLSYYHKEMRNDFVWFQKGELPQTISETVKQKIKGSKYYNNKFDDTQSVIDTANLAIATCAWDRIYITTLFTFEWDKTVSMIEYAKTLVSNDKIYVGGVLATLMSDELEATTGIKPMSGLINCSQQIGFDDSVNIDKLITDFSILDNIDYNYSESDAYFMSCTKGCGMKCSFCAVQKLEPNYEPYLPIKEQILKINELYGEKKNLNLLDNNVLKSKYFDKIIEDIIAIGFGKGATCINPKTKKANRRYVDFNQGLDMNFFTAHKASQLAKIAISPVRIAFDHIDDKEKYLKAMSLAEQNGMSNMSNYMLYCTPDFSGKGTPRKADTPEDLYERIRINVDFAEKCNQKRKLNGQPPFFIYSYPMRYMPLNAKKRQYLGDNWTLKTFQAVRKILGFSRGIAYSLRPYFENVCGKNIEDFKKKLLMPTLFLIECCAANASLGSEATRKKHTCRYEFWHKVSNEWDRLYDALNDQERKEFSDIIQDNVYNVERFANITNPKIRLIYLHYFPSTKLIDFLVSLQKRDGQLFHEVARYLSGDGNIILEANVSKLKKLKNAEHHIANLNRLMLSKNTLITNDEPVKLSFLY